MTDFTDTDSSFLFKDLSYKIRGVIFNVANQYGLGHKEKLYHEALIDEFKEKLLFFQHELQIPILSWKDGRKIGTYIPDFIVDDKIILELKSEPFIVPKFYTQTYSYLRMTKYELAFVVNFGAEKLDIRRLLFTNNHKPAILTSPSKKLS